MCLILNVFTPRKAGPPIEHPVPSPRDPTDPEPPGSDEGVDPDPDGDDDDVDDVDEDAPQPRRRSRGRTTRPLPDRRDALGADRGAAQAAALASTWSIVGAVERSCSAYVAGDVSTAEALWSEAEEHAIAVSKSLASCLAAIEPEQRWIVSAYGGQETRAILGSVEKATDPLGAARVVARDVLASLAHSRGEIRAGRLFEALTAGSAPTFLERSLAELIDRQMQAVASMRKAAAASRAE